MRFVVFPAKRFLRKNFYTAPRPEYVYPDKWSSTSIEKARKYFRPGFREPVKDQYDINELGQDQEAERYVKQDLSIGPTGKQACLVPVFSGQGIQRAVKPRTIFLKLRFNGFFQIAVAHTEGVLPIGIL